LIGDFTYMGTIDSYPLTDVYRKGNNTIYALMIPDEEGKTQTCKLSLGKVTKAIIYNFKPGSNNMVSTVVSVPNHILSIKVTETPVFVDITD